MCADMESSEVLELMGKAICLYTGVCQCVYVCVSALTCRSQLSRQ